MQNEGQPLDTADKAAIYFALDKAGEKKLAEKFRNSVDRSNQLFHRAINIYHAQLSALAVARI